MIRVEIIVEEQSAEEALRHLLPRMLPPRTPCRIINMGSKHKLLKALPARLAAYRQRIDAGESLRLVVLVDRDDDDCMKLKADMEAAAQRAGLSTRSSPSGKGGFTLLNRIVIEELESWYMGDVAALRKAFSRLPRLDQDMGMFRNPDNGGSWEALHRFLKKHGIYRNGFPKIDAARRIAPHMDVAANRSRSFQVFVSGVQALLK